MNSSQIYRPGVSYRAALLDIRSGLWRWSLWGMMGWYDVRQRYRRSLLGPIWVTLSLVVFVVSVSFVYARLFDVPQREFMLFLALGMAIWTFMAGVVTESCMTFMVSERLLKEMRVPLSAHVLRVIWRNFLVFLHNIAIYPVIMIYLGRMPEPIAILAIVGILLVLINAIWISLFLAIISVRFRDIPPIAGNLVQISFFLTPVIWDPALLGGLTKRLVVDYNPLNAMLQSIRGPLMGDVPSLSDYGLILAVTLVGSSLTLFLFARYRARIVYWL